METLKIQQVKGLLFQFLNFPSELVDLILIEM